MKRQTKRLFVVGAIISILLTTNALPVANNDTRTLSTKPSVKPLVTYRQLADLAETKPTKTEEKPTSKTEEKPTETRMFIVTAYTGSDAGMRGNDITATGVKATPYVTVAASPDLPFGTVLVDTATNQKYIVQDRGGAIKGNKLDLYVGHSNRKDAFNYGVQKHTFQIIRPS